MKDAGLPVQQINLAFGHFDERAAQHFTNPNVRNLADMDSALQRIRAERREESEAIKMATGERGLPSDLEEAEQEDEFDGYDASHGTTTRATESLKKRPMKGQGKAYRPRASTVTNSFNAHITNFHAATPIPMDEGEGEDAIRNYDMTLAIVAQERKHANEKDTPHQDNNENEEPCTSGIHCLHGLRDDDNDVSQKSHFSEFVGQDFEDCVLGTFWGLFCINCTVLWKLLDIR
eukprot:6472133-Amphidinium_carterae.1